MGRKNLGRRSYDLQFREAACTRTRAWPVPGLAIGASAAFRPSTPFVVRSSYRFIARLLGMHSDQDPIVLSPRRPDKSCLGLTLLGR